jgi:hypothetical protein
VTTGRRTIDYRDPEGPWLLAGAERRFNDSSQLVIFLDDLDKCTATDLQAALRRSHTEWQDEVPDGVYISYVDGQYYDPDISHFESVSFHLHDGALAVVVELQFDADEDRDVQQLVNSALQPLLRRHRMTIVQFEAEEYTQYSVLRVRVWLGFNTRGRTLRQLFDLGNEASALVGALEMGALTRSSAADLIRSGEARMLIGHSEGHWLDVKNQHYD